jgi:multiple sugar transport system substrate-binding protein
MAASISVPITRQSNSEPGRQAAKILVEQLQPLAPPGNLTWDFPEMLDGLSTGTSGQGMMWPGGFGIMLDPLQSSAAKDLAVQATPGASLLGGWSVGVNNSSASMVVAALWAAWLTSAEVQRSAPAPARISILSDPDLVATRPHFPALLEAERRSRTLPQRPPVGADRHLHA